MPSSDKPVHIVISGTTLWNPGDDFVREGVIAILRAHYAPRPLNLFFYNFSADVLPPHGRLGGVGNTVGPGDLEKLGGYCDAVVIAGLAAGYEVKDLYEWIIGAGLTDRVVMVGAGYENSYVEKHCRMDPEATIFANARLITGRTEKKPAFLESLGTPYVRLPCPSVLSVERVKEVATGATVRRIGFSIQLPHEHGIVNQSTGVDASDLAIETMLRLAERFEITLIAHHKTEYLDFIRRFDHPRIRTVFQSFARDLAETYRSLDLIVTTRLHAGLGANAHGVPALIINDTDRHTHALDGFSHSARANDRAGVDACLDRLLRADLHAVATELQSQKEALMASYLDALREPLATPRNNDPNRFRRDRTARRLLTACGSTPVKHRVLSVLRALTPDHWLEANLRDFAAACKDGETWIDAVTVLNWWARAMQPRTYLEIGVRRGRSMAQVLTESPDTHAWGFDLWIPEYGSIPDQKIHTENPGPDFVREELRRVGAAEPLELKAGCSHKTLPAFFASHDTPQEFDLILVDGDHTADGARQDLQHAFDHLAPGGAILFDDISHPSHPELLDVWESFQAERPDWIFAKDPARNGIAIAVRPPFDRLEARLDAWTQQACDAALAAEPVGSEPGAETLMRRLLKPGMTAVDIGAHAGRYTRAMARLVGPEGRVIALEPNPASASALQSQARRLALDNITVERAAASDTDAVAAMNLYGGPCSAWSTLGAPEHRRQFHDPSTLVPVESTIPVRTNRLDTLLASHGIDRVHYCKIDAEGFEPAVIRGMCDALARAAVSFVQFEISRVPIQGAGETTRAAFDALAAHAYRCHAITPAGGLGDAVHDSAALHQQFIAVAPHRPRLLTPADRRTPIHFFTIVLNGSPFIERHIEQFRRTEGPWHWHIVEGVSELAHDTAWSLSRGGRIPHDLHRAGRSIDGTSEYLDRLAAEFPDNVTVYRKPPGRFWDGKTEMVSAPLANIHEPCLLWQVDADEMWTAEQAEGVRRMFAEHPDATAAYYHCHYFVGPDKVITSANTYGNHTDYEWIRTWRFTPGCRWQAHEPPQLMKPTENGWRDLARLKPIKHDETAARGLVFQHFAYATEAQLRFKESYYGYADAVAQWRRLQDADAFPVMLKHYFAWVQDETTVDLASAAGVAPMIDLSGPVVQESTACAAS
ncbi:MAG: FkbM family methyltransferase [Phycisphaerales bacterium]|nr:FkbM family methyltransferase [Planctomycetota bacterium]MCH8508766.1 FkbM family methyltransferase [Phycisphaerales bacterium]